ncbi:flagellar basal-body rod protein FlgF [Sulfuriferula plumbiphila]|uniref:Flagellar basal-body rod protein FlgF n=1 Tax=Sulfuriferula plumbiphila TaxID=171865 RepID=A0A512L4E3_9PROT|nr:flagellar basal-body rod protein FlgF [Sulfuriferula plumbiphila]BBP03826.1 flagellar basal-body rod protein FlgF [Sulfuriferula plumbiphila]GEP29345.1 flagellar basal-body rod protein FlgF [Sulfuriferula plumbiphila]
MDRLIYTAMTGAKHILEQQATTAHNLANATTTGFRAQLDSFRAVPVISDGLPTRAFVVDSTVGSDFTPGAIQQTGRDLDVAVQGQGWIAVEPEGGAEAYTRNGSLKLSENGVLQTQNGLNVLGEGGPISIPPDVTIAIAKDGTVSAIPKTGSPAAVSVLGRIKLVNPPEASLVRGDDGYFRTRDGSPAAADPNVTLVAGALEGSNVSVVEAMVNMISLGRQFEMQMKLLQNAENNANKASQLLSLS